MFKRIKEKLNRINKMELFYITMLDGKGNEFDTQITKRDFEDYGYYYENIEDIFFSNYDKFNKIYEFDEYTIKPLSNIKSRLFRSGEMLPMNQEIHSYESKRKIKVLKDKIEVLYQEFKSTIMTEDEYVGFIESLKSK